MGNSTTLLGLLRPRCLPKVTSGRKRPLLTLRPLKSSELIPAPRQQSVPAKSYLRSRVLGAEVLGTLVPPHGVVQPERAAQGQRRRPQQPWAPLADRGALASGRRPGEAGPALYGEGLPGPCE